MDELIKKIVFTLYKKACFILCTNMQHLKNQNIIIRIKCISTTFVELNLIQSTVDQKGNFELTRFLLQMGLS